MANPLVLLGLGAAFMYFTDPQSGRKRRADLKSQLDAGVRRLEHGRDVVVRDATNRAHGLLVETRQALEAKRLGAEAAANAPTFGDIVSNSFKTWGREKWSPSQRALAAGGGAAFAAFGYARGGFKGMLLCLLGSGLVARATSNAPIETLLRPPLEIDVTPEGRTIAANEAVPQGSERGAGQAAAG